MKNSSGCLTRWALALQPFSFEVLHRPGPDHANADAFSRQAWDEDDNDTPEEGEGSVGEPHPSDL